MKNNLSTAIDALGRVNAEMAELQAKKDELKKVLDDLGPGAYEGELFRVTISESIRQTLDMEAAKAKLGPRFIKEHTTMVDVRTVRVTARIGKMLGLSHTGVK